ASKGIAAGREEADEESCRQEEPREEAESAQCVRIADRLLGDGRVVDEDVRGRIAELDQTKRTVPMRHVLNGQATAHFHAHAFIEGGDIALADAGIADEET